MTEILAADIGGTHARFAIARIGEGRVRGVGEQVTLRTNDHVSLETAWEEVASRMGRPLPSAAAIAFAGPVGSEVLKLTNNPWVIRPAALGAALGLTQFTIVNDFGAVAHAVAQLDESQFVHLCGPQAPLPERGCISIVGPGTGLGVAQLLKRDGAYEVIETEGGHIDFAPRDAFEDEILRRLRERYRRVSIERVASGQGLANVYEAICEMENRPVVYRDDKELWQAAIAGTDTLAAAALDRFCLAFGGAAGDIALAQGADAVVIGGGVGLRLLQRLPRSGFRERFIAKGRFERRMDAMPVKLIKYEQPGLFGAAAAFAAAHGG
jgi:glucokinase